VQHGLGRKAAVIAARAGGTGVRASPHLARGDGACQVIHHTRGGGTCEILLINSLNQPIYSSGSFNVMYILRLMCTQHPDSTIKLSTAEEVEEAAVAYLAYGCDEVMVDYVGKATPYS